MPDYHELQPQQSDKTGSDECLQQETHLRFGPLGESIFQSLPVGVVTFAPDLTIIKANQRAATLLDLDDTIDKSLAKATTNPASPGPDWTFHLKSTVAAGNARTFDTVSYTWNGKTKLLRIECTPLKKLETKAILGGTLIIEDITEKVSIQRQLAGAQKLAAVGKIASKVAHELNNPIDGILRYINLALRIIEKENLQKPKHYLTQCRQGLMRMVHIVSELLEFSRTTYAPFEYVNVDHIIEDAIRTMDSTVEASSVRISRNYSHDLPKIRSGNLFQVFCNLIKNALDAMTDGGQLNISTRLMYDSNLVVQIHDTGTGFPPKNAETIFEPFFTTKDKGKGTGLGLAICRDIIEKCHGRITAENASGGGSIFTVYLPITD